MEFITKDDLSKIVEYSGQIEEAKKHQELSKIYHKLEFLCQKISEKGYRFAIRKDPRKQAGRGKPFVFQEYQWAQIYPPELYNACVNKCAYIIGLSDTLHFHIRGMREFEYLKSSEDATKLSWTEVDIENSNYEQVVDEFLAFEEKFRNLFVKTGVEFGIQECKNLIKLNYMEEFVKLLKSKGQIILQGPPGTGKTYTAKNLAYYMVFGKTISTEKEKKKEELKELEKTGQYKLIQFHPAFSYEDFVRGITVKPNGIHIEYVTEDRVLADFANDANENYIDSHKDKQVYTKEKWVWLQFDLFKDSISLALTNNPIYSLNKTAYIFDIDKDAFRYTGENWPNKAGLRMKFKDIVTMYLKDLITRQDVIGSPDIKGLAKHHAGYYCMLLEKFLEFLGSKVFIPATEEMIEEKKYVLIIDEINRANLPSVLGELIYALEYRNEAVESMYELDGDRKIIIPPNLYIIGTMNTADRSVGHIDYAIRRRFAFINILPDKSIISLSLALDFFNDVENLFDKHIANDFEKSNVMLGHSYFLVDNNKDLKLKLKYEVFPILEEYLKDGVINKSEESLQLLKKIKDKIESLND